jgi:hypothetical protein
MLLTVLAREKIKSVRITWGEVKVAKSLTMNKNLTATSQIINRFSVEMLHSRC